MKSLRSGTRARPLYPITRSALVGSKNSPSVGAPRSSIETATFRHRRFSHAVEGSKHALLELLIALRRDGKHVVGPARREGQYAGELLWRFVPTSSSTQ